MPVAERAVLAIMLLPALAVLVPFFLLPMAVLVRNSIWIQQAPGLLVPGISLDTYLRVLTDLFYLEMFANTFGVSLAVTLLTVLIGYPFAYFIRPTVGPVAGGPHLVPLPAAAGQRHRARLRLDRDPPRTAG